jgi:general secretion pathway protein B
MSYILEALADSEHARLQVAGAPKYSLLPAVGEKLPHHRRWPYALAGALLVNAVVLQVWLRPAPPGGVALAKAPTVLQLAETQAASTPGMAPSARSEKPGADVADVTLREARPPQPERVDDRRVADHPAPADVAASAAPASPANGSALMPIQNPAPKVMAKRNVEASVATVAKSTPTASVAKRVAEAVVATAAKPTQNPSIAKGGATAAVAMEAKPSLTPSIAKGGAEAAVAAEAKPTPTPTLTLTPTPSMATRAAEAAVATEAAPSQTSTTAPSPTFAGSMAEMPPGLQREMPALSVAGFIRDEGSSSMVIVNDRLVREGDEVAPGVTLEKIINDSLVFNYKGYRFKR